jgi:hypothetical protein
MGYYRLYFLNGGGHIDHFREFYADTDAAAVAQAADWRGHVAMELWSGQRKVKGWEALGLSPEAQARAIVRAVRPPS